MKNKLLALFELTNGDIGESFVRCYAWVANEEDARAVFAKLRPNDRCVIVTKIFDANRSPFISDVSDVGFGSLMDCSRYLQRPRALWFGSKCCVPLEVARCPECGSELAARSFSWNEHGQPGEADIELDCLSDLRGSGVVHRWSQDAWQPVRDAIARWCNATPNP